MLIGILDFFGFFFIMLAAFTISSKYVIYPKVRLFVFITYLIACFFLITWSGLSNPNGFMTWFTPQQLILMLINVRGIRRAIKDIKIQKTVLNLKFGK